MFQRKYLECYRTLRAICGNRNFNSVHFRFFYIKLPILQVLCCLLHKGLPDIRNKFAAATLLYLYKSVFFNVPVLWSAPFRFAVRRLCANLIPLCIIFINLRKFLLQYLIAFHIQLISKTFHFIAL